MLPIALLDTARDLPEAWRSRVLARIGGAQLKLVRMDGAAYPEESHDFDEGLLVLDGEMMLRMNESMMCVRAGELCVVPAGVAHSVEPGSHGTLLILDT